MSPIEYLIAAGDVPGLPRCNDGCLDQISAEQGWATAAECRWRHCGVGLRDGSDVCAYGLVAPAWHRPGRRLGDEPEEADAVLVALWIDPGLHGQGTGLRVVQGLAAMLVAGNAHALDAVGSRFRVTCRRPGVRFLQRAGFQAIKDHPTAPRMRLHLDASVPTTPDLRELLARLAAGMRLDPPPQTAPRVPSPARVQVR